MLRIFIGYDPAETVAFHVLNHSLQARATSPIAVTPINRNHIPEFTRPKGDGSTEFSFSRFLTPYMAGYEGYAVFMDCDMLAMADINQIMADIDPDHAVSVVQHDYTPKTTTKFLGNKQHVYPKKNWSSVMVFNCAKCRVLTPDVVNTASGKYLHQFEWTDSLGAIDSGWNHLVGEYDPNPNAKLVHFTLGTPCFEGFEVQEYADAWRAEREQMLAHD